MSFGRPSLQRPCLFFLFRHVVVVFVTVLVLVVVHTGYCTTTSATAAPEDNGGGDATTTTTLLECVVNQHTRYPIRPHQVNDNYCDCPFTGIDEPKTAACAGSQHWPATTTTTTVDNSHNDNKESSPPIPPPLTFPCPQQPGVHLSLSKVHDGICDCCDGADEEDEGEAPTPPTTTVSCPDTCQEVLRAQKQRLAAQQRTYTAGAQQRRADLTAYATLRTQGTQQLTDLQQQKVTTVQTALQETNQNVRRAKTTWITRRLQAWTTRVATLTTHHHYQQQQQEEEAFRLLPDLRDFLRPLTMQELQQLLVHACQLAGEIKMTNDNESSSSSSCVPLRLAGLAAGVAWQAQTYHLVHIQNKDDNDLVALADVVHANMESPQNPQWRVKLGETNSSSNSSSSSSNDNNKKDEGRRRRLEEDYDVMDDDYDPYQEDYYINDMDEDDAEEERMLQQRQRAHRHKSNHNRANEQEGDASQREIQTAWVKEQAFSVPRVRFLDRTNALLEKLDALTKDDDDDENDSQEEETEKEAQEEANPLPEGFDPMAVPLLRTQINRRREAIETGIKYAVSARVLLQNVEDRDILESLVYGVWYYGRLSAWHMWQAYQSVVPELGGSLADAQSCRAVWACPPAAATRTVGREQVMMPPAFFVQVADEYCRNMSNNNKQVNDAATVCAADDENIPTEITDGMYGYYSTEPRGPEDASNVLFEGLAWEEDQSEEYAKVKSLLETKVTLENKKSDIEREIKQIQNSLGENEDGSNKYGEDGELYSLRNTCLDITAGKYVYELCLFKSAKQKEGNSSHGTDLGKWSGSSVTEEGQRVWSWENGAKCWNGPKRSAWAYITCGATNKIISADEPETCKYVFEVESHLACDENYRIQNNLS